MGRLGMNTTDLLDIDGSTGEGGGQMLRSSLSLSLLTGQGFRLRNIRANRDNPGLQAQHLASVRAAKAIGGATTEGDFLKSRELTFVPGAVKAGEYRFDIGTAGATSLVVHTIYLPLLLRSQQTSKVTITGGTHVKTSPSFHFLQRTWATYLRLLGLEVKLELQRPGFYPRGGGLITAEFTPATAVKPLRAVSDPVKTKKLRVTGFSAVASLPEHIAERQAKQAMRRLRNAGLKAEIEIETWPQAGPGSVLGLVLHAGPVPAFFSGLGELRKPAEQVADDAVEELLAHVEADPNAVDIHSADQLPLPLAFASGTSSYPVSCVTQHLLTNIAIIRRFLSREIVCEGEEGQPGVVKVL
jgi:RNA 3'-terminal phosphate cyclase (ATP)